MEFRRSALDTLEGPEDLDTPVQLTSARGWIVLAGLGLVVVAGLVWGFTGVLPRDLAATGTLANTPETFAVQSIAAGRIGEVLVSVGNVVAADTPIATVTTESGLRTVMSAMGGRVDEVPAKPGQVVTTGTVLAKIARVDGRTERLAAVVFLPEGQGTAVLPGGQVDLTVQSAPAAVYGVLRGQVMSLEHAEHPDQGTLTKVLVALRPSGETPSGYAWSTRTGPPDRLATGTPVVAAIHLPSVSPIELVSP